MALPVLSRPLSEVTVLVGQELTQATYMGHCNRARMDAIALVSRRPYSDTGLPRNPMTAASLMLPWHTGRAFHAVGSTQPDLLFTRVAVCRHNQWYKQHRQRLVTGQLILRVLAVLVSACKINPVLQARLARAVYTSTRPGPPVLSVPRVALSNATKPLFVAAVITQGYVSATREMVVRGAQHKPLQKSCTL